jgi:uncharacterized membrane protein
MTPMQIFEGTRNREEASGQELDDERLGNLAQAIRQHEGTTRGQVASAARPQDRRLYRRLREVCGKPA